MWDILTAICDLLSLGGNTQSKRKRPGWIIINEDYRPPMWLKLLVALFFLALISVIVYLIQKYIN